eukprot:144346_1
MTCRSNSHALVTSYIQKLRLAFHEISATDSNINSTQFRETFRNVFNGISDETVDQLYTGFCQSSPSRYTAYNSTINYESLLKDERLTRIVLILHNYTILQITEFHRDASNKILGTNDLDAVASLSLNQIEYEADQRARVATLLQKLRHSFGETAKNASIHFTEFKRGFESVFMGITDDIYQQIFDGFDTEHSGQIDYSHLLNDDKLPKILLLLHQNAMTQITSLQRSMSKETHQTHGETPHHDDAEEAEPPSLITTDANYLKVVHKLRVQNKELLEEMERLREEVNVLKEENDAVNDKYLEWRGKYELEVEQNKAFHIELENDLEEEFKVKLDQTIDLMSGEREKYELHLQEMEIKYEEMMRTKDDEMECIKKEYDRLKEMQQQATKNGGVFGVIKGLFNATEEELSIENKAIGVITLNTLNRFSAGNEERKLISIYGEIFDVTGKENKYGSNGIYCDLTGHDITLCVIFDKWDSKWIDKFVQLNYKQIQCVKDYIKRFKKEFEAVGKLKNYQEIQSDWPKLTEEELEELQHDDDCVIM